MNSIFERVVGEASNIKPIIIHPRYAAWFQEVCYVEGIYEQLMTRMPHINPDLLWRYAIRKSGNRLPKIVEEVRNA